MDPLSSTPSPSTKASLSQAALPSSKQDSNKLISSTSDEQSEPISISPTSQELKQYTEIMAELPDIRKKRIDQIQSALESGTYSVSSQDLADKIIQDLST